MNPFASIGHFASSLFGLPAGFGQTLGGTASGLIGQGPTNAIGGLFGHPGMGNPAVDQSGVDGSGFVPPAPSLMGHTYAANTPGGFLANVMGPAGGGHGHFQPVTGPDMSAPGGYQNVAGGMADPNQSLARFRPINGLQSLSGW